MPHLNASQGQCVMLGTEMLERGGEQEKGQYFIFPGHLI